jgi:hypothetical protein
MTVPQLLALPDGYLQAAIVGRIRSIQLQRSVTFGSSTPSWQGNHVRVVDDGTSLNFPDEDGIYYHVPNVNTAPKHSALSITFRRLASDVRCRRFVSGVTLNFKSLHSFVLASINKGLSLVTAAISLHSPDDQVLIGLQALASSPALSDPKKLEVLVGYSEWNSAKDLSLLDFLVPEWTDPYSTHPSHLLRNAQKVLSFVFGPTWMSRFFERLIDITSQDNVISLVRPDYVLVKVDDAWREFWQLLRESRDPNCSYRSGGWSQDWVAIASEIPFTFDASERWKKQMDIKKIPIISQKITLPSSIAPTPVVAPAVTATSPTPTRSFITQPRKRPRQEKEAYITLPPTPLHPPVLPNSSASTSNSHERPFICMRQLAADLHVSINGKLVDPCPMGNKCKFRHNRNSFSKDAVLQQVRTSPAVFISSPADRNRLLQAVESQQASSA